MLHVLVSSGPPLHKECSNRSKYESSDSLPYSLRKIANLVKDTLTTFMRWRLAVTSKACTSAITTETEV